MAKLLVLVGLGALILFGYVAYKLMQQRWFRWLLSIVVWLGLTGGAVLLAIESDRKTKYWAEVIREQNEKIAYQEGVLAKLQKGKKPSTKCKYKGFDSYHCYCVDEEKGTENTTTNAKRKKTSKGLYCLDEDGLRSEISSKLYYVEKNEKKIAQAEVLLVAGVAAAIFFVLCAPLLIYVTTRKKPPPPGGPPGPYGPAGPYGHYGHSGPAY